MKTRIFRPVLPLLALPLLTASALGQTTGISHPDSNDETTTVVQTTVQPVAQTASDHYIKPSHYVGDPAPATVQIQTTVTTPESYPATATSYPATAPPPPYQPVQPSSESAPALIERHSAVAPTPSAAVSCVPVETASVRPEPRYVGPDDGVVTSAPDRPHELNAGTVLRARLDQELSTDETRVGARFSAQLLAPAGHSGEVMLPAGSIIFGRVTKIHGGKRITGSAAIRIQPETVNLPDGTSYRLAATVSGLDGYTDSHVTDEGTILAKNHAAIDAAALGLTTTGGAVAGAMIGGGVGAAVGAGIGAGVGTYMWLNRDHQEMLPTGTTILFSLDEPLLVTPR